MKLKKSYQLKEKDICKIFYKKYKILKAYNQFKNNAYVFKIPNEQNCSKYYTMELLRMGLVPGVADYGILIQGGKIGFLEAKRSENCKLSPAQKIFQKVCKSLNTPYYIFWDADDGIEFVTNFC